MKTAGIVAFAFGTPSAILSNRLIAEVALEKAREINAPVYTQLDVPMKSGVGVTYTNEKPSEPPPTLRIARGAVRWAKERGFQQLWIVAAKPHLWRALRDTKEAVREARAKIEVLVCKKIEIYHENFWFCPDSTQERTCSCEAWEKREKILKLMPYFIYKYVAS